jgi:hypothetical protein
MKSKFTYCLAGNLTLLFHSTSQLRELLGLRSSGGLIPAQDSSVALHRPQIPQERFIVLADVITHV